MVTTIELLTMNAPPPQSRRLFEMPYLMTGPVDFQLGNAEQNADEVARLTAQPHEVIEHEGPFLLGHSVIDGEGEYFLINTTSNRLVYYSQYDETDFGDLGIVAAECVIWRQAGSGYPNITRKVFMGLMMDRYGTIISDSRHSADGQRFWVDRMAEARQHGWTVGLLTDDAFEAIREGEDLQEWLTAVDGWGSSSEYEGKRFLITKHAYDEG
jgi:hypothetical protein